MPRREPGASSSKPDAYTIRIKRSAEKAIADFSDTKQDQIDDAILGLVQTPRPGYSKKIAGHPPLRRLKLPPFRIIYVVDDEARTILILLVERRFDSPYKRLDLLVCAVEIGVGDRVHDPRGRRRGAIGLAPKLFAYGVSFPANVLPLTGGVEPRFAD